MTFTDTEVVVVGAGPTGLMLAAELAAADIRTTVLERRSTESNLTRAFTVHARTLELLDARGLADALIATGSPVRRMRLFDQVRVDLTRLPSRFPYVLVTPQYNVESLLARRAEALGADIVRGAEVTGLRQDATGVDVELAGGGRLRASYMVGADGVRSRVRQALRLPFPGETVIESMMLADVRLTGVPDELLAANAVGDCFAFVVPFGDGWHRVVAWDRRNPRPDSAPVDLDEIRRVTRRALGTDFDMHDPRWLSRFHSDERQVPRYRVGRIFLAGDAAHVHSPAAGMGMNTGIQDAANLGWKLAATLRGSAPEGLLDTYHAERHPVGRLVLRGSGTLLRLVMVQSLAARTARNAVGAVVLRTPPIARRVTDTISGIGISYPAGPGAHPLAGKRAADALLTRDGQRTPEDRQPVGRLYEALRRGTFVLLSPAALATAGGSAVAEPWSDRVRTATTAAVDAPTTLIRPDGYVAWATGETDPQRLAEAIRHALTTFCGPPASERHVAEPPLPHQSQSAAVRPATPPVRSGPAA